MTPDRNPWHAIFRLLERDERIFAVLLAVAMVGGLATLGLVPLRPRHRIDLYSLVLWFALYKLGIFALVTVNPRATRSIFLGALAIDLRACGLWISAPVAAMGERRECGFERCAVTFKQRMRHGRLLQLFDYAVRS